MGGAGFLLAINLSVAALFAVAFLTIATYDRTRIAGRWFGLGYLCGMAYFASEALLPLVADARLVSLAVFASFLMTLATVCIGVARNYRQPVPWRLIGAIVFGSLLMNALIYDMPRQSFLRLALYQAPYVVLEIVAAGIVLRAKERRLIDTALGALLLASALQFASKPFIAVIFGAGASPQDYIGSTYALISQTMGAVLMVATGLLAMAILVRDIVVDATAKSETDTLSGLLNRRGFEMRARDVAKALEKSTLPAAIVICDLDHFKAVNDTYGHAAGDRVIAGFADHLRRVAEPQHLIGRIGGEEFAVLLPGTTVAAARLFAEGVRVAFGRATIDGLPAHLNLTASFGVAEIRADDTIADMLRRADIALYEAKRSGRDAVRVSTDTTARAGYYGPVLRRAAGLLN